LKRAGRALRRRVLVAVILFLAAVVGLRVAWVWREFDTVVAAAAFEAARDNHTELRAFLRRMPKGGDLHTHLAGAVYAERYIAWGAQERLCADLAHVLLTKPQCDEPGDVPVADAMRDQNLYDRLVNAFSTRAFVPTVTVPTDHDKFFAAFDKFSAASSSHFVEMAIDQLREYHSENAQYVEFMTSFYCPDDRDKFLKAMAEQPDDAARLAALQTNGLDECVTAKRSELAAAIDRIRSELACDPRRTRPGCGVTFRFIAQIGRNSPVDDVFPADRHCGGADPRRAAGGRAQLDPVRGQPGGAARLYPPHADRRLSRQGRAGRAARGRALARLRSAAGPHFPYP
jgi:adenosine deaminase